MKKIIFWVFVLLFVSFFLYKQVYVCSTDSRAGTDLLVRICTDETVKLSNRYEDLEKKQEEISKKAKEIRWVRDMKVAKVNEYIKKDKVFHLAQK